MSIKIGDRVRVIGKTREYIVLDRHYDPRRWWLQDAETGAIGEEARDSSLEQVSSFRGEVYDTVTFSGWHVPFLVVKSRFGRWVVLQVTGGWNVAFDRPSKTAVWVYQDQGIGARRALTLVEAKGLAQTLHDRYGETLPTDRDGMAELIMSHPLHPDHELVAA